MDERNYQSLNYTIQHAKAIAAKGGYGIDSCSNDAINNLNYSLSNYPMVFWIGGQQAEADTTDPVDDTAFRTNERLALAAYLTGGGKLLMTGSELAWDYGRSGVAADKKTFLQNYLKTTFINDSANTYRAVGAAGIFAGLPAFNFDNGTGTAYQVRFPDVISPAGGATACLSYSGGTGGTAGIQYAGTFGAGTETARLVYMGFGFETITDENVRNNVMSRIIDFFNVARVNDWSNFQ